MSRLSLAAIAAALAAPTAVAAVLIFGCACGTMQNNGSWPGPEPGRIYGGVRLDLKEIGEAAGTLACPTPKKSSDSPGVQILFRTVDLPLSAAADTLSLPWNIADTIRRCRAEKKTPPPLAAAAARGD